MEQTDSCQRGAGREDCMKEGEGISPRTYMHNPHREQCVDVHGQGGGVGRGVKDWMEVCKGWRNREISNSVSNKNKVRKNNGEK